MGHRAEHDTRSRRRSAAAAKLVSRLTRRRVNELFPSPAWRHLLPDQAPERIAVLDHGPVSVTAAGSFPEADAASVPGTADLAIATGCDDETLARLHRWLKPGGVAYLEVPWSRVRSSGLVERRLATEGFGPVELYSLSPSSNRWAVSWWVPLNHPAAVRFVLDDRRPNRSAAQRPRREAGKAAMLMERLQPWLARHPWLIDASRSRHLCVVARKPGGSECLDAAPALARSASGDRSGSSALMRIGGSSTDQPMLFVFAPGATSPSAVVKAPSRPEEVAAGGHEGRILASLASPGHELPGVPRPLDLGSTRGVVAVGQSYLAGTPMAQLVSPDSFDSLSTLSTDWLVELAATTGRPTTDVWCRDFIDSALSILSPSLRHDEGAWRVAEPLQRALAGFRVDFTVYRHCDFGPWNLRVDDTGALGVIDWADAVAIGPPGCDLVHHLAHLAFSAEDAYGLDQRHGVIARLMDPGRELGALVDDRLQRYASATGLDPASIDQLRLLTWVLDLLRQAPGKRSRSLYFSLLRAELDRIGTPISVPGRPAAAQSST